MHILVAEDEKQIAQSLKKGLEAEGFSARLAKDGKEALNIMLREKFDAILLDWRMPEVSGIDVCRQLRASGDQTPIILLTALSDISNKIEALDVGADDYITKPFSFEEVIARIRAVVRRSQTPATALTFDDLKLDLMSRLLRSSHGELKLPEMEFVLLKYFIQHKNSIISKEQLARDVWKLPFMPTTNFIEATVKNLRKKLEEFSSKKYIQTIYGEGYLFIAD
jgi:DNA-binding response OmpR family regulator